MGLQVGKEGEVEGGEVYLNGGTEAGKTGEGCGAWEAGKG